MQIFIAILLLCIGLGCLARADMTITGVEEVAGSGSGSQGCLGSGGFNPNSVISSNGGLWRADVGVTQSSGAVSQWNDQSFAGQNLTQSTGANKPTWSATGFNTSFNGITFVSTGPQFLGNTGFSFAQTNFTHFMLMIPRAASASQDGGLDVMLANGTSNDVVSPSGGLFQHYNTVGPVQQFYGATGGAIQGNGGSAVTLTTGTTYLIGFSGNGTNANTWINGTAQGSATGYSGNMGSNPNNFRIGTRPPNSNGAVGADVTIAFAGVTGKVLSSTDWTNLRGFSNTCFGTSI